MSDRLVRRPVWTGAAARNTFDALRALLVLASAAAALAALVLPINQLTQPGAATRVELAAEAQQQALAAITGVPEGSWLEFVPDVYSMRLHVFALDWPLRLLSEAGPSLLLACLAGAGLLLSRTLRTVGAGAPFDPANPRRLRLLGLLLVVGGVGGQCLEALARIALLDEAGSVTPSPVVTSASLDLTWVVAGLLALAFAEAFAAGRRLSDDVAGLI